MNEKKQSGFKIGWIVALLVAVLLLALLFVDFGNHGKELSQAEVFQIIDGTYRDEEGDSKQTARAIFLFRVLKLKKVRCQAMRIFALNMTPLVLTDF